MNGIPDNGSSCRSIGKALIQITQKQDGKATRDILLQAHDK